MLLHLGVLEDKKPGIHSLMRLTVPLANWRCFVSLFFFFSLQSYSNASKGLRNKHEILMSEEEIR